MLITKQKIQVFISSACGDEPENQKYNYVREGLRLLIESTGFAEVYDFDFEGASTVSAGQHFTHALKDCDVCIFLIDNKDGVPSGVETEIGIAKKHNIKSLFYFCDQFSKKETPLQKSLRGANFAKSKTIHDFRDFIKSGAGDLINDLVAVYKQYCKGRLAWDMEEQQAEQSSGIFGVELSTISDSITPKNILSNIDLCVDYFTKQILERSYDEAKKRTGEIDRLCSLFLPVLFEGANINEDNINSLLAEIEKYQATQHFAITKKRYDALKEYFSGNQEACMKKLEEALQMAKLNGLPEWLVKDILIDLRNQSIFLEESHSKLYSSSKYQKDLDSSQILLYYPLLDRFISSYNESIIEEALNYKIQSPLTVTIGHRLNSHIVSLSSIFVLAMYNGSLSHLLLLYRRLKYLAFYCSSRYSGWDMKKLLLKTAIIDGKQKEISDIINYFDDMRSKMNDKDASEIYDFANNRPIEYKRIISKLEAFRIVSYYMDDEKFTQAWDELYAFISLWIESKTSLAIIGYHIFAALENSHLRISHDQLIEIIYKCIENKMRRFYNEIFKLICQCVSLDKASPDNVDNLLKAIIKIVRNPYERQHIPSLKSALIALRVKNKPLTDELDKVVSEEMPDFYKDTYRLETSIEENIDMSDFIEAYISQMRSDNESQGKGGLFFGRSNQPHITIKNILAGNKDVEFSENLLDSAFRAACETLFADSQEIEAKIDAIELLVYLIKSHPNIKERNNGEVDSILSNKQKIETAHIMITNLTEMSLRISALFLYHCLEKDIIVELLEALADIGDDVLSNLKTSGAILNFLEADSASVSNIQLEHIILQQAIKWSMDSNLDIRWNAVLILFSLLKNLNNKNIICNQLVKLMDIDNAYIKNRILRNVCLIKDIDEATYKYIIQKGTVDTNYAVRLVAGNVQIGDFHCD